MNKKLLKLKPTFTLEQKDQDKRDAVIESMRKHGLPEQTVDSFIYRIGLDSAFAEIQRMDAQPKSIQPQNEHNT